MGITSVAALIAELNQSRLLGPPQLDEIVQLQPRYQDPRTLARHLLERGWLTPFHINQLFQGRGKDLILGPYLLLARLGEGGMGAVFKARHQKLDRIVALKVIRKDCLAHPEAVRRFQHEIRAASQVTHPNIVHSFDAGQIGDTHYIAMEFVEGVDLARLVKKKGALPIAQACDYLRQAALGLQHAHEKGLVHRDIKPSNLLRASGGVVKILDLGLARIPRLADDIDNTENGTLTQVGSVVGTPDYLAPEQARDAHAVDIRADLYSLGCTLFFLLTGQVPFPDGTSMEKIFRHQLDPPPSITDLRPDVPPALAAVVHRLLAKRPEQRYQIPLEVAQVLEPFLVPTAEAVPMAVALPQAQQPTGTRSEEITPAVSVIAPQPRKRPNRWAVFVAALVLLGGAAFVFSQLGSSKTNASDPKGEPLGKGKWTSLSSGPPSLPRRG